MNGDDIDIFGKPTGALSPVHVGDLFADGGIEEKQIHHVKPTLYLPGACMTVSDFANKVGKLLRDAGGFYIRGRLLFRVDKDVNNGLSLIEVKPAMLASVLEKVAYLQKCSGVGTIPGVCVKATAEVVLACEDFVLALPRIIVLTSAPVLIERDGKLIEVCGYDEPSGVYAGGEPTEQVRIDDAVKLILELFADYRFTTPGDRARAVAMLITPALIFGGLLNARSPMGLVQADASQSGKGYQNKQIGAVYGNSIKIITQGRGGIGGIEESFCKALIDGHSMIALDNIRGKIDSPKIESFLTEDNFSARSAYHADTMIDTRKIIVLLTSNCADVSADLANRCCPIRIIRQDEGYEYRQYAEGDVLDHVRAKQPLYLGAVFSIIQAWHDAGKPRTTTTAHDFRPWARVVDWITQNIIKVGSIADGLKESKLALSNPHTVWLRLVMLEVQRANRCLEWLRVYQLLDLIEGSAAAVHGTGTDSDDDEQRAVALQTLGRKIAACFPLKGLEMNVDNFKISRQQTYFEQSRKYGWELRFEPAPIEVSETQIIGANQNIHKQAEQQSAKNENSAPIVRLCCAYEQSPIKVAKLANAPNAPIGSEHFNTEHFSEQESAISSSSVKTIGGHRRIGANSGGVGLADNEINALLADASQGAAQNVDNSSVGVTVEVADLPPPGHIWVSSTACRKCGSMDRRGGDCLSCGWPEW